MMAHPDKKDRKRRRNFEDQGETATGKKLQYQVAETLLKFSWPYVSPNQS
jgi:hypothetical protein